jgi:carbon monoxide dehydrogenase subunit G
MEKLLNEFTVHRPIEQAWAVLTDVERIAPCLPGAQLEEIEGEVFRGVVKVKLGAISTAFRGQAKFVERDDAGHRAVLHGEGRDTTGKGNADAMITARLEAIDATSAKCVVETELHITGKVAQFGRGIMGDVSKKLIAQFATNLNAMIDADGGPTLAADIPAAAATAAAATTDDATTDDATTDASDADGPVAAPPAGDAPAAGAPAAEATEAPKVRKIDGPAAEPIELTDLAGGAVLKRLLPALGGLVILLLVLRRIRKR